MEKYNIIEWINYFEGNNDKVDPETDFLETTSTVLYPGRFYVLEYMAKTKERFNSRPVIISMGVSKKEPDSFLCVDLSVIPYQARIKFIEMYFNIYRIDIENNINKFYDVKDAERQTYMRSFSYENLCKTMPMLPIKKAIKKYKIENTMAIYAVPFSKVYKIVGKYCDENHYVNGSIAEAQREFIQNVRK